MLPLAIVVGFVCHRLFVCGLLTAEQLTSRLERIRFVPYILIRMRRGNWLHVGCVVLFCCVTSHLWKCHVVINEWLSPFVVCQLLCCDLSQFEYVMLTSNLVSA